MSMSYASMSIFILMLLWWQGKTKMTANIYLDTVTIYYGTGPTGCSTQWLVATIIWKHFTHPESKKAYIEFSFSSFLWNIICHSLSLVEDLIPGHGNWVILSNYLELI